MTYSLFSVCPGRITNSTLFHSQCLDDKFYHTSYWENNKDSQTEVYWFPSTTAGTQVCHRIGSVGLKNKIMELII